METIYNNNGNYLGTIDKANEGVNGWFATLIDNSNDDYNPISESWHPTKRLAIAWLKRKYKNNKK